MSELSNNDRIVVWDPEQTYQEGALVTATQAKPLEVRGVVMLPCVPMLFARAGVGGFSKRAWGAGVPLSGHTFRHVCPLTLFLDPTFKILHWVARLVPEANKLDAALDGQFAPEGSLRFAADQTQRGGFAAACTALQAPPTGKELGKADQFGGWSIGGRARVDTVSEGYYGFSLFGALADVRVSWLAASLTAA